MTGGQQKGSDESEKEERGRQRPKWLNRMSSVAMAAKPELKYHWLHAAGSLDPLLGSKAVSKKHKWRPFRDRENELLEDAWNEHLNDEDRANCVRKMEGDDAIASAKEAEQNDGSDHDEDIDEETPKSALQENGKGESSPAPPAPEKGKGKAPEKGELVDPETIQSQRYTIPVGEDGMFQVNVKDMSLYPVYWQGFKIELYRASWFHDSGSRRYKPVDHALVQEIEKAYDLIRPWQSSYIDELRSVLVIGEEAEAKMRYNLPTSSNGTRQYILFQDAISARLFTEGISSRIGKSFLTALRGSKSRPSHGGGKLIFRGHEAVTKHFDEMANPEPVPTPSTDKPSKSRSPAPGHSQSPRAKERLAAESDMSKSESGKETTEEAVQGSLDAGGEVAHLVLVIHGIGQKLAATYEDFDFVHAVNMFRNLTKQQLAAESGLKEIVDGKRIQYLPVKWRARFEYEAEITGKEESDDDDGYTVDDVTPKQGIQWIRQMVQDVYLDVPAYQTPVHRDRMIKAVCQEANRIYRLFCQRNPYFERNGGQVSIIGHSLGAVLAMDILSAQDTFVPPLAELDFKASLLDEHFVFNTHSLFLFGSPVGIFMMLNRVHLVARQGRQGSIKVNEKVAANIAGRYGCPAIDKIYNIYHVNDPIATNIACTVDRQWAKDNGPTQIATLPLKVLPQLNDAKQQSKLWGSFPLKPFFRDVRDSARAAIEPLPKAASKTTTSMDLAEQKVHALNPNGSIDYFLPARSMTNQYLEAISSHSSYWENTNVIRFVMVNLFWERSRAYRSTIEAILEER